MYDRHYLSPELVSLQPVIFEAVEMVSEESRVR